MAGRNVLKLNHQSMVEALNDYLNKHTAGPKNYKQVVSVNKTTVNTSTPFEVVYDDPKEKE